MIAPDSYSPRPHRFRARRTWGILGLFAVLTLAFTWPLASHLGDRLPGTATWAFDESTFAWNIWYFKHALLDLHSSPLHTELIWRPLGIDLILYTYNFFNALIALPLQLAGNVPFASNITLLLSTVLSGLGAYLLARYVLSAAGSDVRRGSRYGHLAALVAGVIYAFASNRAVYAALGHYDMVTTQWLPFYALYLLKTLREPRVRNAVMAGLFFALAALAEMIFASFLAMLSLLVVAATWRQWQSWRAVAARLGVLVVVALLIWSPVLVPVVGEFLGGDYALEGWGESVKLSADVAGLVTPTDLNPLLAPGQVDGLHPTGAPERWVAALRQVEAGEGRFGDINTVFLGWITLALAVLGSIVGRRHVRTWTWAALIFGILALGPLLQLNGRYRFSLDNLLPEGVSFPLPFTLLHYVPFINANRAPNRYSVILMLALAVLAAWAVAWLLGRVRDEKQKPAGKETARRASPQMILSGVFGVLLMALILLEHLAVPLPLTDARVPAVYEQIAASPGDFAIMQLPLGWRNSFGVLGSEQTQLQYFQVAHGKPIIGGNISRAPDFKMTYFARLPLFRAITDLEMYREVAAEVDQAARAQAGELMALYNVRYFVMTPAIPDRYPYVDTAARTEAYALDVLPLEPAPVWEQDGYRVYRVTQPAIPYPFRLDLGTPGLEPYLGQGLTVGSAEQPYGATANWVANRTGDIYLPVAAGVAAAETPARLRLAVAPLAYEGAPAQTLTISVNGIRVGAGSTLAQGWQTIEVEVPASALRAGPNRVQLAFDWAVSPREVFPDDASRAVIGGTGVVSPVNLDVHSFSQAFISSFDAEGREVNASVGRRGYNVAVIDERSGSVLDSRGFDTAANPYEADALADYLDAIPRGRIVVLATKEDATANLTPAAIAAFRGLGSRVTASSDLMGQAHALVGVKGAVPGAAAEAIAADDAFLRMAGDFRTLAAAVDWIELGP